MPKRPEPRKRLTRSSLAYRRAIRMDAEDWMKTQVRERDEAARKAREAEMAAVLADLAKNKPT